MTDNEDFFDDMLGEAELTSGADTAEVESVNGGFTSSFEVDSAVIKDSFDDEITPVDDAVIETAPPVDRDIDTVIETVDTVTDITDNSGNSADVNNIIVSADTDSNSDIVGIESVFKPLARSNSNDDAKDVVISTVDTPEDVTETPVVEEFTIEGDVDTGETDLSPAEAIFKPFGSGISSKVESDNSSDNTVIETVESPSPAHSIFKLSNNSKTNNAVDESIDTVEEVGTTVETATVEPVVDTATPVVITDDYGEDSIEAIIESEAESIFISDSKVLEAEEALTEANDDSVSDVVVEEKDTVSDDVETEALVDDTVAPSDVDGVYSKDFQDFLSGLHNCLGETDFIGQVNDVSEKFWGYGLGDQIFALVQLKWDDSLLNWFVDESEFIKVKSVVTDFLFRLQLDKRM